MNYVAIYATRFLCVRIFIRKMKFSAKALGYWINSTKTFLALSLFAIPRNKFEMSTMNIISNVSYYRVLLSIYWNGIFSRATLNYATTHHHPPPPTTTHHHPPPPTTTHHHPPPSTTTHPPPPTTSQNMSTTIHHHPPTSKIYPPLTTTSQKISTTTYHFPKNGPPPGKSQNILIYNPF